MLRAKNVSYEIEKNILVDNFSYNFSESKFIVIMGKNGAGKTTLLKILAGSLKPTNGKVLLYDTDISKITSIELAKTRAVLSQHYEIPFAIDVSELVMLGRYPYFKTNPTKLDYEICDNALQLLDISNFKDRDYNSLSGGEARKVHLARAFAQVWEIEKEKKILFLDEPVSNLDLKYQHQIIKLAKERTLKNTTVISVLHDLNLANTFADEIIFMKSAKLHSVKNKEERLDLDIINDVFETDFEIIKNPVTNIDYVVFKK